MSVIGTLDVTDEDEEFSGAVAGGFVDAITIVANGTEALDKLPMFSDLLVRRSGVYFDCQRCHRWRKTVQ